VPHTNTRADFQLITNWVEPNSRVLDLGCGDGSLLALLNRTRATRGYGVEINDDNIVTCVKNGINVIQNNLESGLSTFESDSFDYVILSQTLQAVHQTESIVKEMLRVGRQAIVTFPNFGYWRNRWQILAGRMPVSKTLPYQWYDTPNVHLCTINDFEDFCHQHNVQILEREILTRGNKVELLPNWLGNLAVYRIQSR
jgi:methionine biosynthesis protein MetW